LADILSFLFWFYTLPFVK